MVSEILNIKLFLIFLANLTTPPSISTARPAVLLELRHHCDETPASIGGRQPQQQRPTTPQTLPSKDKVIIGERKKRVGAGGGAVVATASVQSLEMHNTTSGCGGGGQQAVHHATSSPPSATASGAEGMTSASRSRQNFANGHSLTGIFLIDCTYNVYLCQEAGYPEKFFLYATKIFTDCWFFSRRRGPWLTGAYIGKKFCLGPEEHKTEYSLLIFYVTLPKKKKTPMGVFSELLWGFFCERGGENFPPLLALATILRTKFFANPQLLLPLRINFLKFPNKLNFFLVRDS